MDKQKKYLQQKKKNGDSFYRRQAIVAYSQMVYFQYSVNYSYFILFPGDLAYIKDQPHLIANKFHLQKDRISVGCMDELHYNRTRDEFLGTRSVNTTYYANLGFVKKRIRTHLGRRVRS